MTSDALAPYDAVLLLSFGGPEAPDEVMPFLRRVTAGRGIPDERLQEVAHHYALFGGRSPINDQNRALIAALEAELTARGIDLPVFWGNRNSHAVPRRHLPRMRRRGLRRAAARDDAAPTRRTPPAGSTARTSPTPSPRAPTGAPRDRQDAARTSPPGFVAPITTPASWSRRSDRWPTSPTPSSPSSSSPTRSRPRWTRRPAPRRRGPPLPAAPRSPAGSSTRGAARARPRPPPRARLLLPLRPAEPALARTRRQRPPRGAGGRRPPGGRPRADRIRLRPHGGRLRPRHRGRRRPPNASDFSLSGRPRSGSTRPSSPASSTCSRNAPRRLGEGWSRRDRTSVPRCAPRAAARTCDRPARPSVGATDDDRRSRGHDLAALEDLATGSRSRPAG